MRALRLRLWFFATVISVATPISAHAQKTPPQISDPVATELGKLRELTEAKDYAPALALIDRLLGAAPAESYDHTLLSQIKAQIFLAEGDYATVSKDPRVIEAYIGVAHG